MRRLVRFLFRNWPLKMAAVLLATLLYSGLVLSQNERTYASLVPVDAIRPPRDAVLLADIEPVREIRFRAPLDVGILSPDSFRATVDLSGIEPRPGGEPQNVRVRLEAIERGIQIIDFSPREVPVRLDFVEERQLRVSVEFGSVPEGISVGAPQTEPSTVTVSGPSSRVSAVRSVVARVTIDASALNIDRDVELVAVDSEGNQVPRIQLDPTRARVRIPVALELANRTLPVVPDIVGMLPDGYQITAITVDPLTVTVSGSAAVVNQLEAARTEPIDVGNRTRDFETVIGFNLPSEASVVGSTRVTVTVGIMEISGSRTFLAGPTLVGASSSLTYVPAVSQVTVTLEGPLGVLNSLTAGQVAAHLDVADLEPGTHPVPVEVSAPGGLEVVAISPAEVLVRVEEAPAAGLPPSGSLPAAPSLARL